MPVVNEHELTSFEYETVTVDRQGQVVARQRRTAGKFSEPLESAASKVASAAALLHGAANRVTVAIATAGT